MTGLWIIPIKRPFRKMLLISSTLRITTIAYSQIKMAANTISSRYNFCRRGACLPFQTKNQTLKNEFSQNVDILYSICYYWVSCKVIQNAVQFVYKICKKLKQCYYFLGLNLFEISTFLSSLWKSAARDCALFTSGQNYESFFSLSS
mgnify:CR=1 FL=1